MTDLTLEELDALQGEVDRDDSPVVELSRPNFDALLAMARELVRLRGALFFLKGGRSPNVYIERAVEMGWPDPLPPSERKGEG